MRRLLFAALVLSSACGGSQVVGADETTTPSTSEAATTTLVPSSTIDTAAASTTTDGVSGNATETVPDTTALPLAPDFTLELGGGGEYKLSASDNPVYLVFWAEW